MDCFVAVDLQDNNKKPNIGKVMKKMESSFKLHYWKGSINKEWVPWIVNNESWVEPYQRNEFI